MKKKFALPYAQQPLPLRLLRRYWLHDVGRCAAALAYYFLFTLFPLLILITALLTQLGLPPMFLGMLQGLAPRDVLEVITNYVEHLVSFQKDATHMSMSLGSLFLLFYFTMRAMNCVVRYVRIAYGVRKVRSPLRQQRNLFFATLLMVIGMLVSLAFMSVGRGALQALSPVLHLSTSSIDVWNLLRFALMAALIFGSLLLLYHMAPGRTHRLRAALPGTLTATGAWLLFSFVYAYYVEHISNYSLLYGTLGAAIALLLWLYLGGFVLILGAEVNAVCLEMDAEMRAKNIVQPAARRHYRWICGWNNKQSTVNKVGKY